MRISVFAAGLVVAVSPGFIPCAHADMITFEHESISFVTGEIGQTRFNAPFVIRAVGDTNDREQDRTVWWIDHLSASIEIQGVGTFDFLTPTRTFVNNSVEIVGFSRAGVNGTDLFNGPADPILGTWDMTTSIGPLAGLDGDLTGEWSRDPQIETTGGVLEFDPRTDVRVIFTATVTPVPATILVVGYGCVYKRRRRG